jgi:hypothetical protein
MARRPPATGAVSGMRTAHQPGRQLRGTVVLIAAAITAAIAAAPACNATDRDNHADARQPSASITSMASRASTGSRTSAATGVTPTPREVCARFVTTMLSVDATTDSGPEDARRRAVSRYGSAGLFDTLIGSATSTEWPLLVAHHARTEVRVTPVGDDPPPISPTQTAAGMHVQRSAVGAHGWRAALTDAVVYCALARAEGAAPSGWRVTAVTVSDAGGAGR